MAHFSTFIHICHKNSSKKLYLFAFENRSVLNRRYSVDVFFDCLGVLSIPSCLKDLPALLTPAECLPNTLHRLTEERTVRLKFDLEFVTDLEFAYFTEPLKRPSKCNKRFDKISITHTWVARVQT